ncbi:hypothetical protein M8J76_006121 [Diaphorina citri]|nr:hypothetical protein M8J75_004263 [Diaphorina citri]KAI5723444.1 hypothetical protein M8J76_006121 [Diaphorina citri]
MSETTATLSLVQTVRGCSLRMPQDACSDCVYRGCSLRAARVELIEVSGELVGKRQCSKAPRSELFE